MNYVSIVSLYCINMQVISSILGFTNISNMRLNGKNITISSLSQLKLKSLPKKEKINKWWVWNLWIPFGCRISGSQYIKGTMGIALQRESNVLARYLIFTAFR